MVLIVAITKGNSLKY